MTDAAGGLDIAWHHEEGVTDVPDQDFALDIDDGLFATTLAPSAADKEREAHITILHAYFVGDNSRRVIDVVIGYLGLGKGAAAKQKVEFLTVTGRRVKGFVSTKVDEDVSNLLSKLH